MKSNAIPLEKMVISFICGLEITERFYGLEDNVVIFPANSFWKMSLDLGKQEMKVILQNCQDKTQKTISYETFGKVFTMKTDRIVIIDEEDVPVIINLS